MQNEAKTLAAFDFTKDTNWIDFYYSFDIAQFEKLLKSKNEVFWQKAGEQRALRLFHFAAKHVPAYKDFLKKHGVRPASVKTVKDFKKVPFTDKKNYIQAYPLRDRMWPGSSHSPSLVAVSSGTSGEPTFWPRGAYQEFEAAVIHELVYKNMFGVDKKKTLAIIGFPMGVYVSGVATTLPSWMVAQKKYKLTIMSVGNNKSEMLRAAKSLGKDFEQVLLVGHPFFIKDVIETGKESGIAWKKLNVRMMFCSEGFSEAWRRYVLAKAGISNPGDQAISTYGSSEMLLMAHETSLSIKARGILEKNAAPIKKLFGGSAIPDLFQYNPLFRYIESEHKDLVFTSASGVPLIRFNLHDSGAVVPYAAMQKLVGKTNTKDWKLPFVALWGRSDQTIIFYAANIYPEHIKVGLDSKRFYSKLTGKFVMRKGYMKNMDEFLEINVELTKGTKADKGLVVTIQHAVVQKLQEINMEYSFLCKNLEKDLTPRITLWPYQHEKYFRPSLKPRYINR